jgi:hypothetical protein
MIRVQDLGSMGRLTGVRYFSTQEAYDEEKMDIAEIRRAKASLGDDYDPLEIEHVEEDPIRDVQVAISQRIQGQFDRRVLRRIIESVDWEGKKLVELPPLHKHTVLLSLQPFERDIHEELAAKMRQE